MRLQNGIRSVFVATISYTESGRGIQKHWHATLNICKSFSVCTILATPNILLVKNSLSFGVFFHGKSIVQVVHFLFATLLNARREHMRIKWSFNQYQNVSHGSRFPCFSLLFSFWHRFIFCEHTFSQLASEFIQMHIHIYILDQLNLITRFHPFALTVFYVHLEWQSSLSLSLSLAKFTEEEELAKNANWLGLYSLNEKVTLLK